MNKNINCIPTEPMTPEEVNSKVSALTKKLQKDKFSAALMTDRHNIFYFTGFTDLPGVLLIEPNETPVFFVNLLEEEQVKALLAGREINVSTELEKVIKKKSTEGKWKKVLLEPDTKVAFSQRIEKLIPSDAVIEFSDEYTNSLRCIKTPAEIAILRRSASTVDNIIAQLLQEVKPGMTEWEIRVTARKYAILWSQDDLFTIIAAGANSSKCHHSSGNRVLNNDDILLMDIGVEVNGYNSDITRTVFYGNPAPKLKEIYNIVLEANMAAIEMVKPGVLMSDLHRKAYDVIESYGYADRFFHGLGHGLGLSREGVLLNFQTNKPVLENMCFTIEPGIYIPGLGGVRIEDMVLVTENGCEVLTKSPKELCVL